MCRFLVYKGSDEILLSKLILDPTHSILKQSFDARLRLDTRRGQNNADGFGIGFYTDPKLGQTPCLFRSTIPAWNCSNLERIASKTASRLVFAHVRAATDGTLSEDNCHPFSHGSLMFMHNGGLGGWKHIKRRLTERLADKWYHVVNGGTDSEWAFALFLDTLERMGCNPSAQPEKGFGPEILRKAMLRTIAIINEMIDQIPESTIHAENVDTRSLLNFVLSDGHSVICTRYINSSTDQAASLYYSSGSQWEKRLAAGNDKDYQMQRRDKGADVVLVASEPLTFERESWVNVPTNSILTIHGQTVMVHPIVDAYSNRGPAHSRSAAFVQTKGLVANEKISLLPRTASPFPGVATPEPVELPKKHGPTIPLNAFRPRNVEYSNSTSNSAWPNVPYASTSAAGSTAAAASGSISGAQADNQASASAPPPLVRQQSGNSPAQGNIKKKRMSLNELEQVHGLGPGGFNDTDPITPITPAEPPRNNYGDPNKIARFFPELTLST
ncbi:glutamine amidotransferase subunit [Sporothrix eucalyptigena]|uniref:Glutamine amidotransferase subunit n=1 Tax=Sporothrix eucalyptigena TaxID=1812306 RepID=A0ABP0CW52_9PEZI